ncbi:MAG: serine protease [Acinetobacter sp.]|uniref:S1 family peptidase n=1 Tax=Acinetobacter sp. TaxID=472 RepID=UPI000F9EB889|nr:serine protease [Acinetobacter sp.]RUP39320.1 MAG: serine protease [Acinetobacter sp.]
MLNTFKYLAALGVALLATPAFASDFETVQKTTVPFLINGEKACSAVLIPPFETTKVVENDDGKTESVSFSTGVRVVTAKHCTEPEGKFEVAIPTYDNDGRIVSEVTYLLGSIKVFGTRDVAVFKFEGDLPSLNYLPFADVVDTRDLKFGDELIHVGYPQSQMEDTGLHQTVTDGRFQEYTYNKGKPTFIRADVPAWYGSSGGGLWKIDGDDYKLVGITSKGDINGAAWMFTFYSPVELNTLN